MPLKILSQGLARCLFVAKKKFRRDMGVLLYDMMHAANEFQRYLEMTQVQCCAFLILSIVACLYVFHLEALLALDKLSLLKMCKYNSVLKKTIAVIHC